MCKAGALELSRKPTNTRHRNSLAKLPYASRAPTNIINSPNVIRKNSQFFIVRHGKSLISDTFEWNFAKIKKLFSLCIRAEVDFIFGKRKKQNSFSSSETERKLVPAPSTSFVIVKDSFVGRSPGRQLHLWNFWRELFSLSRFAFCAKKPRKSLQRGETFTFFRLRD